MKQIRPGMKEYQMERYYNKTKKKEKKNSLTYMGQVTCSIGLALSHVNYKRPGFLVSIVCLYLGR